MYRVKVSRKHIIYVEIFMVDLVWRILWVHFQSAVLYIPAETGFNRLPSANCLLGELLQ